VLPVGVDHVAERGVGFFGFVVPVAGKGVVSGAGFAAGVEWLAVFDLAAVGGLVAGGEHAFAVPGGEEVDQVHRGPVGC
jgi:hypothetical protein